MLVRSYYWGPRGFCEDVENLDTLDHPGVALLGASWSLLACLACFLGLSCAILVDLGLILIDLGAILVDLGSNLVDLRLNLVPLRGRS